MSKIIACHLMFGIFLAFSSHGQTDWYRPFKLILISPDNATIDATLKATGDSLNRQHLRNYYAYIKYIEDALTKLHARDSSLKKHYIEGEDRIRELLAGVKKYEIEVRKYKYYQSISNFSALIYEYYFNANPPYSTIDVIPSTGLNLSNFRHLADSLNADYIIGYKNIRTEKQERNFIIKLTTILYSKKYNTIILEKEISADDNLSKDGIWSCRDPLSCLLNYAVKSSTEIVFGELHHRQRGTSIIPDDNLKGSYPILNRTLDLLKKQHVNNYNDDSLYTLLISKVDSVFQLRCKVTYEKNVLVVHYKNAVFRMKDRDDFIKFCKSVKPEIESALKKLHFMPDYDYYLADQLVSRINYESALIDKTVLSYENQLAFTVDKNNDFILYDDCFDIDHNTIKSGSLITEFNNIPIKYFTKGTAYHLLSMSRYGYIEMQVKDSYSRIIDMRNCNLNVQQGFEYMLDYNGTCCIKFNSQLDHRMTNKLWEKLTADCDSINRIIIDLRTEVGGQIREAMDLANLFIRKGLLMAEIITKGPDTARYLSLNYNKCNGKPIYIFINRMTSGAGEIIAGILKEHRGATLIGEEMLGNTDVQSSYQLSNNYYLSIFDGIFITAGKYSLKDDPIPPDISFDSVEFENLQLSDFR